MFLSGCKRNHAKALLVVQNLVYWQISAYLRHLH